MKDSTAVALLRAGALLIAGSAVAGLVACGDQSCDDPATGWVEQCEPATDGGYPNVAVYPAWPSYGHTTPPLYGQLGVNNGGTPGAPGGIQPTPGPVVPTR